jgi:C-terminal processing protease CtpA/Prc
MIEGGAAVSALVEESCILKNVDRRQPRMEFSRWGERYATDDKPVLILINEKS